MKIKKIIATNKLNEKIILTSPTLKDAEQLAEHANKVFAETKFLSRGIEEGIKNKEDEEKWITTINENKSSFIICAKLNNKIVGIGNISSSGKGLRFRHICTLGISIQKEFWGRGIGKLLMTALIENAIKLGYERIKLDVAGTNYTAQNLYKKFGFIEYGRLKNAMKYNDNTYEDMINMIKKLD